MRRGLCSWRYGRHGRNPLLLSARPSGPLPGSRRALVMTATRPLYRVAVPILCAARGQRDRGLAVPPIAFSKAAIARRSFSSLPDVTTILMPALSPTMTHGTITSWLKKPGDVCNPGDVLCEVETDKATIAFEVQDECVMAKILVDAKTHEVKVGHPVALAVETAEAYAAFQEADKAGKLQSFAAALAPPAEPISTPSAAAAALAAAVPILATKQLGEFALSPAARHMLDTRGLDLRGVLGTGKDGRITKGDVIRAISAGHVTAKAKHATATAAAPVTAAAPAPAATAAATPAPATASAAPPTSSAPISVEIPEIKAAPGTFKDTPNNNMRKIIARRLAESKATVPHSYETVECELDKVLSLRKRLQKDYEVNVSVNDLVIRSAALALRDVPEANAFWDSKKGAAVTKPSVDISVAVATPAGLITPIIPSSDKKRLVEISTKMKDLAGRAKANKLKPEEFQGGSFTISNLGMFGIDEFSAVINPPQGAIMAVGRGSKKVKVPPFKEGQNPKEIKPYVATIMTATLSFDRRVMDDAVAGQFLQAFKAYISQPELLLL